MSLVVYYYYVHNNAHYERLYCYTHNDRADVTQYSYSEFQCLATIVVGAFENCDCSLFPIYDHVTLGDFHQYTACILQNSRRTPVSS